MPWEESESSPPPDLEEPLPEESEESVSEPDLEE